MTPTAFGAARRSVTALSTPPLIATAARPGRGAARNTWPSGRRERLDGERLAADGGSLEQRQAVERPLETGRVRARDPVSVDAQSDGGPFAAARGIPDDLCRHASQGRCFGKCPTLPVMPRPPRTWLRQVGAVRGVGNAYPRRRLPSRVCWFTFGPRPRTGSSAAILPRRLASRSSPWRSATRSPRSPRDPSIRASASVTSSCRPGSTSVLSMISLRTRFSPFRSTIFAPQGSTGCVTPEGLSGQHLTAGRPLRVAGLPARAGEGGVPARRCRCARERRRAVLLRPPFHDGQREHGSEQGDASENEQAMRRRASAQREVWRIRSADDAVPVDALRGRASTSARSSPPQRPPGDPPDPCGHSSEESVAGVQRHRVEWCIFRRLSPIVRRRSFTRQVDESLCRPSSAPPSSVSRGVRRDRRARGSPAPRAGGSGSATARP